ncbi:MAG: hypothetical protein M3Q23_15555 [Actinomycetota bacterium]|nr:hypothetical protein [Actinomycetota bacterium]
MALYQRVLANAQWDPPRPELVANWESMFPEGESYIQDWVGRNYEAHARSTEEMFNALRRFIVEGNANLSALSREAPLVFINSWDRHTGARQLSGTAPVILVDANLTTFIWSMNKAWLYGSFKGTSAYLTQLTLLRHALMLRRLPFDEAGMLVETALREARPPHPSPEAIAALLGETWLHEMFVLAHEMAHIELGHLEEDAAAVAPILMSEVVRSLVSSRSAGFELAADELALRLLLNAFGPDRRESMETVMIGVFLITRYFVWLELVVGSPDDNGRDQIWLPRHLHLREVFRSLYEWGSLGFISELLEELEQEMEPGAFTAAARFRNVWNVVSESTDK